MVRNSLFIILVALVISSCRRDNGDPVAQHVCACFDSIHDESVRAESEEELEAKVRACSLLLSNTLDSFGDDNEKRASFMKAYRECQEK